MAAANEITVGTRVAYKRDFLRSTGQITGWVPFARGAVIAVDQFKGAPALVTVAWDKQRGLMVPTKPSKVLITNLVREDRIHLEPV